MVWSDRIFVPYYVCTSSFIVINPFSTSNYMIVDFLHKMIMTQVLRIFSGYMKVLFLSDPTNEPSSWIRCIFSHFSRTYICSKTFFVNESHECRNWRVEDLLFRGLGTNFLDQGQATLAYVIRSFPHLVPGSCVWPWNTQRTPPPTPFPIIYSSNYRTSFCT